VTAIPRMNGAAPVPMVVVGLGRIGRVHAENLAIRIPNARLAGVVDVDGDRARNVGRDLNTVWSQSAQDFLDDPSVLAVAIATPTETHAELVEAASSAGKHVFCEKPLALDREDGARAASAARGAGVKLQVGFHLRFDPGVATLADRVRAGELGQLYLVRATMRDMRPPTRAYLESSGGFLLDGAIHTVDLVRHLGGEIAEVAAFGAALSDPLFSELKDVDNAVVVLRFRRGGLGVLEHSRVAGYGFDFRMEVMGARGTARTAVDGKNQVEWWMAGERRVEQPLDFMERFPAAYRLELEAFVRAILLRESPRVTGEDALAAFEVCQAAACALAERRIVPIADRASLVSAQAGS
jgi:predicted dehydrogenase